MQKVNVGMWKLKKYDQTYKTDYERQTKMWNETKQITMELFVCVRFVILFPIDFAETKKSQCVNVAPK